MHRTPKKPFYGDFALAVNVLQNFNQLTGSFAHLHYFVKGLRLSAQGLQCDAAEPLRLHADFRIDFGICGVGILVDVLEVGSHRR